MLKSGKHRYGFTYYPNKQGIYFMPEVSVYYLNYESKYGLKEEEVQSGFWMRFVENQFRRCSMFMFGNFL